MNLLLQVFFSLHVSLSEVCAFYSKENIFYILLTVDFFVVNIFCIFIYKSHKKNSNVQLYTLNLQLEENKVNSVVSGLKCAFVLSALHSLGCTVGGLCCGLGAVERRGSVDSLTFTLPTTIRWHSRPKPAS